MTLRYNNLRKKTRLLLAEALSTVRSSLRDDPTEAMHLPQLVQLEQRILMSASPAAVVAEPVDVVDVQEGDAPAAEDVAVADPHSHDDAQQGEESGPHDTAAQHSVEAPHSVESQHSVELVVIDPSANDHEQLVADLTAQTDRNFEVLVLDPRRDGISQITDALGELSKVSAIHLVSHGEDGEILLGTSVLSHKNIARHAAELVTWQHAMTADADLLIYGCDVAASDEGIRLTESLNTLLGADVAASDDDTGQMMFGGDWILEYSTGAIETDIAFSTDVQQNWMGLLNVTIDGTASTTTAAKAASSASVSHTTSGNNRLMLVGISFGEDKGDTVSNVSYGGQSLTLVGAHDHSSDSVKSRVEIWGLVAPNTGTNNVVVNFSGTNHEGATIGVMTFNNADQVQPWGTFAGNDGSSSNPSVNVESAPTELVFGVAAMTESSNQTFTPGAGQTQHWDLFRQKANGAGTTEAGAASVTTSWNTSPGSDLWVAAGVSVNKLSAVVDTTADYGVADADYGDTSSIENLILDKGDDNLISLREALEAAKNTAGVDTVNFNITGSGPHTISLISALPDIDHEVIINGWSEPAYAGTPVIELDGSSVGDDGLRFVAGSDGSIVRGLIINGFGDDAIEINNTSDITVHGNYLGTNAAGTASVTNAGGGINIVNADSNTIGGTTAAERNVISGNLFGLVNISGAGSTTNVVQGNYLGLNAAGTATLTGNGFNGVWIASGASNNTIGGTTAGAGNVIAGMDEEAIEVDGSSSTGNIIQGNYIGVDAAGTTVLGNTGHGIALENAVGTLIGGTAANAGNLIGGSTGAGIVIAGSSATNNTIQGNFIGTDAAGTLDLANTGAGVRFANSFEGAAGGSDGNLVGGTTTDAGNIIAFNAGDGVRVQSATAVDNAILGNAIHSNGEQGIDLGSNGIDANDTGVQDGDAGANSLQNFPSITSAIASADGSSVDITFSLDSEANTTYRIEFFENQDTETNGEGLQFLGSTSVTTNGSGLVTNQVVTISGYGSNLVNLDYLTATATLDDAGTYKSTSEFGSNHRVQFRPGISVGGTRSFIEDGGSVFLDTSITIVDLDSPNFNGGSLTVDIDDANGTTNDRLIINDEGSGSGQIHITDTNKLHYDGNASHFATFSGGTSDTDPLVISFVNTLATQAAVDRLAENIQFDNVSNTPSTAQRNVTFVLNDGTNDSVVDSVNVNVAKTNDPPTGSVTVTGTATEDQTLSVSDTLNDLDGMGTVTYQWQRNGGNITGETGSTYTLDDADAEQNIRVRARYTDGEGNVETVFSNTVGPIVNVNDAPVLDNSQNLTFADVVNAPGGNDTDGDSVLDLLLSDGGPNPITDGDPSPTLGIAINQIDDSNGTWEYSTDGATWNAIDPDGSGPTTIGNNNALLLEADGGGLNRIRFTPNTGYPGTVTGFKFRAWDGTESPGVGNGSYANIDTLGMGADKAFSTVEETASVTAIATYFLDQFESVSYGINDGTHDFAGGWIDSQDGSASAGDIRIFNSGELRVRASTGEINLSRQLDLSAAVSATLTYDLSVNGFTSGHLKIQARTGGAGPWTDVDTIDSTTALGSSAAIDLTPLIAADTEIRIYVPTAGTEVGVNPRFEEIRIDYTPAASNTNPTITSNGGGAIAAINVAENSTAVTTVAGTDVDVPAQTLTYSLSGGADQALFNIDSSSGVLTFVAAPDFESPTDAGSNNVYDVQVQVSDGVGGFDTQDIAVTVTNVDLLAYESFSYGAGSLQGANGGTGWASAWNTTTGSSAIVHATGLTDPSGLLPIQGGTAEMNTSLQFEQSRDLTTTLGTDGTTAWFSFLLKPDGVFSGGMSLILGDSAGANDTVTVGTNNNDFLITKNESPFGASYINNVLVDAQTYFLTVQVDFAAGADTVTLYVDSTPGLSSPDSPGALTAQLTTADLGMFTQVGLVGGFSGNNSNIDEIRVGETFLGVAPSGSNIAPTVTSNGGGATAAINVAENTTTVTTVTATDPEAPPQVLTYSLSGGADQAKFNIDSSSGVLTFVSAPDFESPTDTGGNNVYDVQVQVSDGLGGIDTQNIAVTVTDVNDSTPVVTASQSFSVNEAAANGTSLGTVAATDGDAGTVFSSWTITGGNADGIFEINAATGEITVDDNSNLDFETNSSYTLSLTVSDGTNTSAVENVAITINDVNDNTPIITGGQSFSVSEAAADGASLGTVAASDADAGATLSSWTITGGNTDGIFAINAATGEITVGDNTNLDFETTNSYTLSLTVSDGINTSAVQTVDVDVTAVNDHAPVFTSSSSLVVPENTPNLVTLTATDADLPGQSISFSIVGGDDAGLMHIAGSGILKMTPPADFETPVDANGDNVYEVQVQADDGNGRTTIQSITVTITDVNDNTPVITGGQSFNVSESANNGTSLGTVAASDADAGTTFSGWTITGDNTDGVFAINSSTGEITVADNGNLDFEATTSYTLSLTVSDGTNTSSSQTVAISVTDVNDSTPVITGGQTFSVSEAAADGASLGTAIAADGDAGTTFSSWTITGGNADGIFAIGSSTGEITVADNSNLDFETTSSYTLSFTVSDGTNTSSSETVFIEVTNQNETPVAQDDSYSVTEGNSFNASALLGVITNDSDVDGNPLAVSLISSPAFASAFTLNADGSFSYTHNGSETTNDSFTYQISDGFGGVATATVTLTVSPDDDAPTVSAIADASTPEDTPLGPINFTVGDNDTPVSSLIVTASSNDQSIIADANIAVTGTGANRSVSLSPVANAAGTATITVSVSDGTSITTTSFDVTVTPVNDAPTITSIPDIITNEDSLTASANFTVSDIDTSGSAIAVTAVSSNQSLISDSNIVVRSSGGTRQVQFAPQENAFGGPATITVTVSDGIASASTTFDVTVLPVNDAPVFSSPVSHRYDLPSDESVIVSSPGLLAGVTDVEGDALTVVLDTMPRQGTLTVQADGSFTYEANAEFTGSDSFRFYVTDGSGNSTPRTVIVQAPVTVPAPSTDTGTTPQDGSSQSTTDDETNSGDDTNASDESESPDATTPSATAPEFNDDDDNDKVPPVVVGEDDETDAFAAFQATLASETQYEFVFDLTVAVASEGSDRVENSTLKSLEQQARELWVLNGGDPKGLLTSVDTQLFGYERFAELRGTVHHVTGFEDNLDSEYTFNDITTSTVAVAGTSIVIGSVLTAIRTGMLALGLLSQLPVWTWFDPLLVMDGVGGGEEGDSLQDIVDRQDAGENKKNE